METVQLPRGKMATAKATRQTPHKGQTSDGQMNLTSQVTRAANDRHRAELRLRLAELDALPVTHPTDVALRDDLRREVCAQLKQLGDECPF